MYLTGERVITQYQHIKNAEALFTHYYTNGEI